MRRTAVLAASILSLLAATTAGQAQDRRPLHVTVKPRSWLDAGNVVQPGYSPNPASAQGQMVSYILSPPYIGYKDSFNAATLPDPIGGPFAGAQNVLGPVDYNGLFDYSVHTP